MKGISGEREEYFRKKETPLVRQRVYKRVKELELEKGRRKKIEPSNEEVNESSQFQFLFPTLRRRSRRRIDSPQYFFSRQSLLSIEKSRSNPRVQKSIELHKNTSPVREVRETERFSRVRMTGVFPERSLPSPLPFV